MTLRFTLDPAVDQALVEGVVEVWTAASNAGGSIGFVPPVTLDDVRPTAEKAFAGSPTARTGSSSPTTRSPAGWPARSSWWTCASA